jgi:hypothetical protein
MPGSRSEFENAYNIQWIGLAVRPDYSDEDFPFPNPQARQCRELNSRHSSRLFG